MAPLLNSNLQAFNLTVSTLLKNPSHFLPNLTISTFLDLPEQLGAHLVPLSKPSTSPIHPQTEKGTPKQPKIAALVIDKDNTLCPPNTTTLPKPYLSKLTALRTSPTSPFNLKTNPYGILIVSNTAGSRPESQDYEIEARQLESTLQHLQIPVFRVQPGHKRKPFCGPDVLAWFKERGVVENPDQIAVVGDRIGTDTLMAAQMGSWSVWCKDGVKHSVIGDNDGNMDYRGFLAKVEIVLEKYLRENRKVRARVPSGWETE